MCLWRRSTLHGVSLHRVTLRCVIRRSVQYVELQRANSAEHVRYTFDLGKYFDKRENAFSDSPNSAKQTEQISLRFIRRWDRSDQAVQSDCEERIVLPHFWQVFDYFLIIERRIAVCHVSQAANKLLTRSSAPLLSPLDWTSLLGEYGWALRSFQQERQDENVFNKFSDSFCFDRWCWWHG